MKRWKVIITPDALRDLEDIYYYVRFTLLEPGTAKRLLSRIRKELRSLDYLPERSHGKDDSLRFIVPAHSDLPHFRIGESIITAASCQSLSPEKV